MTASAACWGVSNALPAGAAVAAAGVAGGVCAASTVGTHANSRRTKAAVITQELSSLDFIFSSLVMMRMAYLLLPPPPPPRAPPPPPREPMLEAPRDWLARAPPPLMPDPPK